MGVKKETNNFKIFQEQKVQDGIAKLLLVLEDIPLESKFNSVSAILIYASSKMGVHHTTLRKNKEYLNLCEKKLKELNTQSLNELEKLKDEIQALKIQVIYLEMENTNLRRQCNQNK